VQFGGGLLPSAISGVEQLVPRNSSASRRRINRFIVAFSFRPEARPGRTWCSGSVEFRKMRLIYGFAEIFDFPSSRNLSGGDLFRSLPDFSSFL
jgi:hypothetical protein